MAGRDRSRAQESLSRDTKSDRLLDVVDELLYSDQKERSNPELQKIADNETVIDLTKTILVWSIKVKASDIHIEPTEHDVRIRFRIDGVLHDRFHLDRALLRPVLSRLKVLAGVDVTEHRRPLGCRQALILSRSVI